MGGRPPNSVVDADDVPPPERSGAADGGHGDPAAESLMSALRERHPWASRRIWELYGRHVRRLLARGLGPGEDLDDLTQEVFLRVFSRVHTLRAAGALREFVTTVTVHVLKWELRRRWVRRKISLSSTGVVPDVEIDDGDPEARDALARCYAILDKLGARERSAFVLRYMEEMTMEEVASALSISLSTAKRLVNRSSARVEVLVANDPGLRTFFEGGRRGGGDDGDAGR
jgi:RNA polymerase sigma-70 factor (ECF subfamily)